MSTKFSAAIACTIPFILIALLGSSCSGAPDPQITAVATPYQRITPASGELKVVADKAPLRAEPAIGSQQLMMLERGQILSVLGISTDSAWFLVSTDVYTGTGWIFAELVDLPTARAIPKKSGLILRAGPGNDYDSVGPILPVSEMQVIGAASSCAWLKVIAPDKTIGWISGVHVALNVRCSSIPVVEALPLETQVPSIVIDKSSSATSVTTEATYSWAQRATSTAVTPSPLAVVNASNLNVRYGPGTSYSRVVSVVEGTELVVIEGTRDCEWVKVSTPDQIIGWVAGQFLTLNVPCSSIPTTIATFPSPMPGRASSAVSLLSAPLVLRPDDNAHLDLASAVLEWSPVKNPINSDEVYIVTIQFSHGSDIWTDYASTDETKWSVQNHAYLLDISDDGRFNWSVQLIRATGKSVQGVPQGYALSLPSATRTFFLNRPVLSQPVTPTPTEWSHYRDGLKEVPTPTQSATAVAWLALGLLLGVFLLGSGLPPKRDRDSQHSDDA